ncbi:MAG: efflux RND transporter periplasmic adaptor subunit [Verrucomicrobiota bacterium]
MKFEKLKAFIQVVLVLLFIIGAFALSRLMQSDYEPGMRNAGEERALFASVQKVETTSYLVRLQTTGTIVALAEINVVPEVSGRVVSVAESFFKGGAFEPNTPLFEIDARDFELEVRNREAEVARTETALELERAEVNAALAEWTLRNGEQPVPDLVARKPQVAEAEASLQAAQARLSIAELSLFRTRFQLPAAGRVLESNLTIGQFVQAGVSYGRVFYTGQLEIESSLRSDDLKWLFSTPNTRVEITANHLGQTLKYEGSLQRGVAAIEPQTRFASVRFGFTTPPDLLVPGLFATVTILGPQLDNVAHLPLSALQLDGSLGQLDSENRLRRIEPEIAFRGADYMIVQNLSDGDRIVTSRLDGVADGVLVNVTNDTGGLSNE